MPPLTPPLVRGDVEDRGGVYEIDVSIENQRFTTLTWKTKKDSLPQFPQTYDYRNVVS